ncbi:MAG: VOC family protein [Bacteroidales bacterium]|nr:VOC family protein [Bacteroidales bacterium]
MTVENIERSKHFYQEKLGQTIKEDYGENIVFEGDFSIHLKAHYSTLLNGHKITNGGNNFEIYFEHNDLETLQTKLKSTGVEFVHEIQTQPWQQRVMRIYDPDKNIIEIGESLEHVCIRLKNEGKCIEDIIKLTSLSEEYINQALKS